MASRFPEGLVESVRSRATISEFVGQVVSLKRVGKSLKGRCPFHNEKTPSFHVDDAKQAFYCFGCQAGGDVFKFLMLSERMSFPEAVKKVAEAVGVALPVEAARPGQDRRARLVQANEEALRFYRHELKSARGAEARAYLSRRGLKAETVEAFELGLAPDAWDGVGVALRGAGYSDEEMVAAGLVIPRPKMPGVYDRFRGRVIFPIRGAQGTLVAFGGRGMGNEEPKYLNSPETELYVKGEVLYGLERAREAMRKKARAILVEGYMDLIALHQAGFTEAVASLGTALTESHARLMKRYSERVYICYDGDRAGLAAARRALGVFLPSGVDVQAVTLEDGMDPDDYVRARGAEALEARFKGATSFVDFLTGEALPQALEDRVKLAHEVLEHVALVPDPVARRLHTSRLAERLGIEDQVLLQKLRRGGAGREAPALAADVRPGHTHAEEMLVLLAWSGAPGAAELSLRFAADLVAGLRLGAALVYAREQLRAGRAPALDGGLEEAIGAEAAAAVRAIVLASTPHPTAQQAEGALDALEHLRQEGKSKAEQSKIRRLEGELKKGLQPAEEAAAGLPALLAEKQRRVQELHRLREGKVPAKGSLET